MSTYTREAVSLDERMGRLRTAVANFPAEWAIERIGVELPALLDRIRDLAASEPVAASEVHMPHESRPLPGPASLADLPRAVPRVDAEPPEPEGAFGLPDQLVRRYRNDARFHSVVYHLMHASTPEQVLGTLAAYDAMMADRI